MRGGGGGGGGGGEIMLLLLVVFLFYLCDIDINCLIWGCVLFASATHREILLLLTLTYNLCDDVCQARVWIYSDFKCLLSFPSLISLVVSVDVKHHVYLYLGCVFLFLF